MEILVKSSLPGWVSFDGRVLEIFFETGENRRFHLLQLTAIQLSSPDQPGQQELTFTTTGSGQHSAGLVPSADGQTLVAAVQDALLALRS
jgi:hypothetical protein